MRLNQVDLNLFIVFEVIYREQNLTQAAQVLNISQPAVSTALRRLRRTFNDPLFQRVAHGMVPTPLSHSLIGQVREALWRLNNTLVEPEHFAPEATSRIFRVAMQDFTTALVFPGIMAALRQAAPNIVLEIRNNEPDIVQALTTAALDLSIEPPVLVNPLLYHRPLIRDRFVCLLRRGHPFAAEPLTLERYLELFHVEALAGPGRPEPVELALHALGKRRRIRSRLNSCAVAAEVIAGTDLALTLPARLARTYDLAMLELPFEVPPLELHLYWHKSVDADPANRWLRELVVGCVDRLPREKEDTPRRRGRKRG